MVKILAIALVALFLIVAPSFAGDFNYLVLRWDSYSDTTWSLTGTGGDTSQPFLATPDMSLQHIFNSGTTSDSIKIYGRLQFNLGTRSGINSPPAVADGGWSDTVAGTDSIGYVLTADSTGGTAILDCSTDSPVRWCRLILTGITGNRLSAAITGQSRILFYQ